VSKKFFLFFVSIIFLVLLYFFIYYALNPILAWLAFPIGLLFFKWFELSLFRGLILFKKMPIERLELNLKVAGMPYNNKYYNKILKIKIFLLIISMVSVFGYFVWKDIANSFVFIAQKLTSSKAILKVEYPSFSGLSPKYFNFNENNFDALVDTSSYIEIRIDNLKPDDNWKINFFNSNKTDLAKNYTYTIQAGFWSSSVSSLYNLFNEKNQVSNLSDKNIVSAAKEINIILSNKDKKYYGVLKITPTEKPFVKLESMQSEQNSNNENAEK
jgi:hypothetical protein